MWEMDNNETATGEWNSTSRLIDVFWEKGYRNYIEVNDSGVAFTLDRLSANVARMLELDSRDEPVPVTLSTIAYFSKDQSTEVRCKFEMLRNGDRGLHLSRMVITSRALGESQESQVELRPSTLAEIPSCGQAIRMVAQQAVRLSNENKEVNKRKRIKRGKWI